MTAVVMPDLQGFISQYLRSVAAVTTLVGQRVYNEVPGTPTWPLVRLLDVGGGGRTGTAHWQEQAVVQVDIWGGPTSTVRDIAETIRAALMDMPGPHTLTDDTRIVVTRVRCGRARRGTEADWPGRASDDSATKPHASFDAVINFHP